MRRALVPLLIAVVVAGGIVFYGLRYSRHAPADSLTRTRRRSRR